jgi:iron complex transport system ATP-binding protein
MALLDLEDVSFAYGGREVVSDVRLSVGQGELVALVGPNGSGKTTLLRLASGLLRPAQGRVLLGGRPLAQIPRREAARRISGVAAEEDARFPFTVRESVALGRHPWRGAFAPLSAAEEGALDAALAAVDLAERAARPVTALSSGERRRVSLARCLAQGGDLVLLDEPTAHLDLGHQAAALSAFRARAVAGAGVLAALHDLTAAALVADRVVLLVGGRLVAEGAPGDVLTEGRVAEAFGARVSVLRHPDTGAPVLVPREPAP